VDIVEIFALTITVAALFSYVSHRWLRLPRAIGLMLIGLAVSATIAGIGRWLPELQRTAVATLGAIDFNRLVLHGVLGVLLFAGALHLDLDDLRRHAAVILVLSTVGVVLSTAIVGWLMWEIVTLLGIALPLIDCLLFGALISPTDPIAVRAVLRSSGVPDDVEVQLTGESLFNDGIGVVVFLTLLRYAGDPHASAATSVAGALVVFLREVVGGVAFGIAIATAAFVLIKSVNDYRIEILLSLALVVGGYASAERMHVSAPMTSVVSGLLIGNHGRAFAMSDATRERLDLFWEVIDDLVNTVLFVLVGLLLLTVAVTGKLLVTSAAAIIVTLLARLVSIGIPLALLRRVTRIATPSVRLMTWAGVRGPLSIALALSLYQRSVHAASNEIQVIVVATYVVVIFSVIVHGLTLRRLIRRMMPTG